MKRPGKWPPSYAHSRHGRLPPKSPAIPIEGRRLFFGAGKCAGQVVGSTGEIGFRAVDKPCQVHDIHATVLHPLGLNHSAKRIALPLPKEFLDEHSH